MLALKEAGVDTDGALRRFSNNTGLYERFLVKFPSDENFGRIKPALDAGDFETALTAAHTLKGVSGNLGMDRLYRACTEIVSLIRGGDQAKARNAYTELDAAYRELLDALSGMEGEGT